MTVDGEVFQAGTVKVPLISERDAARRAHRRSSAAARRRRQRRTSRSSPGPATFSATLEWGRAVTTSPGRGAFVLPVPPAGSATATFDVPGEQSDLRVSPGLVLRRTSAGGRTIDRSDARSRARRRRSGGRRAKPGRPPRRATCGMLSDVKTLVTIGDADVRLLSLVDVTIVQGSRRRSTCAFRPATRSSGVSGALARSQRAAGRSRRRCSSRRAGAPAAPVPAQPRAIERGRLVQARHRLSDACRPRSAKPAKSPSRASARWRSRRRTSRASAAWTSAKSIASLTVGRAPVAPGRVPLSARTSGVPALALNVTRFPDAAVLAAIAERAVATTLVTSEGAR